MTADIIFNSYYGGKLNSSGVYPGEFDLNGDELTIRTGPKTTIVLNFKNVRAALDAMGYTVDPFELPEVGEYQPPKCVCDFVALLQNGCKCGGK